MIPDHLADIWNAFHALSWRRGRDIITGLKPNAIGRPIGFLEIDAMANRLGITDRDDFADFLHLISVMDQAFLDYVNKDA